MERITSQIWPMGELIPNEQDLAEEFGVARATVNRAIQEIADAGFVERRRKAGTRVVPRRSRDAVVQIPIVGEQITDMGRKYRYQLVTREIIPVTKKVAKELSLKSGTPAMHLVCCHFADDTVWQFEDRWINLAAVPPIQAQKFDIIGPNEWLVREIPYSNAEHVFRAAAASAIERQHLELGPNEPVFVIERKTWQANNIITWVRLSHSGNRFSMTTRDEIPYGKDALE
ncbi:MAG: UTRA domain-containing protein [Rhizobiales bacterium]|nr:UTRA domain-containing protein [Hyphomicrobiales bacterium]